MFSVQTGLTGRAAKAQASYLAKERDKMLRERHRAELARLRGLIKQAKMRKREALRRTVASCKRARITVRERVRAFRQAERERINLEVAQLRIAARTNCAARKERVRGAGGRRVESARARLMEEHRLERQLRQVEQRAARKRAKARTATERRQESDDEVRSNLPPELHGVWAKVKRTIQAGPRSTRTEAFLEWAEANPEDVVALQYSDVDREVAALVRQRERLEASRSPQVTPKQRRALVGVGLAKTRAAAKRQAAAGGVDDFVPF